MKKPKPLRSLILSGLGKSWMYWSPRLAAKKRAKHPSKAGCAGIEGYMEIKERLNGLDLFSGIGGISLALSEWVRPVAYCERDPYATGVLLSRMAEGRLDRAPIWDDVKALRGDMLPVKPDIIFGGFPCQDISVAGAGAGLGGERSGLFFEIVRLAQEIKPAFIFLENVPAIRTRGLDRVIQELTSVGYDCRWLMLSAADVGANHKRERWFLLAHANSLGLFSEPVRDTGSVENPQRGEKGKRDQSALPFENSGADVADITRELSHRSGTERHRRSEHSNGGWWDVEPNVGRVANGVPNRVDRLKCLGNAVVPEQAKKAFQILMGLIKPV